MNPISGSPALILSTGLKKIILKTPDVTQAEQMMDQIQTVTGLNSRKDWTTFQINDSLPQAQVLPTVQNA